MAGYTGVPLPEDFIGLRQSMDTMSSLSDSKAEIFVKTLEYLVWSLSYREERGGTCSSCWANAKSADCRDEGTWW